MDETDQLEFATKHLRKLNHLYGLQNQVMIHFEDFEDNIYGELTLEKQLNGDFISIIEINNSLTSRKGLGAFCFQNFMDTLHHEFGHHFETHGLIRKILDHRTNPEIIKVKEFSDSKSDMLARETALALSFNLGSSIPYLSSRGYYAQSGFTYKKQIREVHAVEFANNMNEMLIKPLLNDLDIPEPWTFMRLPA